MCHQLDHEKLDVCQMELKFVAWATDLIVEVCESPEAKKRRIGEAVDHLDRAGLSSLFNTSEGNGKRQMKTRAKFFDDARGSATECASCLAELTKAGFLTGAESQIIRSRICRAAFYMPPHIRGGVLKPRPTAKTRQDYLRFGVLQNPTFTEFWS